MGGFSSPQRCNADQNPKAGSLRYNFISKCQQMRWKKGETVTIAIDPLGGRYILHAYKGENTAATDLMPHGWTVEQEELGEDIDLIPSIVERPPGGAPDDCRYHLITDSESNAFHRYVDKGYIPEQKISLLEAIAKNRLGATVIGPLVHEYQKRHPKIEESPFWDLDSVLTVVPDWLDKEVPELMQTFSEELLPLCPTEVASIISKYVQKVVREVLNPNKKGNKKGRSLSVSQVQFCKQSPEPECRKKLREANAGCDGYICRKVCWEQTQTS